MRSMQTLNLGPGAANPNQHAVPSSELAEMDALIEQTRSELRRTQMQMDRQDDAHHSNERRTRILSIVTGLLVVTMIAGVWLTYPMVRGHNKTTSDVLDLQTRANELEQRANAVEGSYDKTTALLSAVGDRIQQFQENMNSGLQSAANQARTVARQAGERIQEEVARSMAAVHSRLEGVESNQHEAAGRVTQLQEQVAGLQRELASVRQDALAANEKLKALDQEQQARTTVVSGLNQQLATTQSAVDVLAGQIGRKRVDFEVESRRTQQIAPGIYLSVTRADTRKQQIDARLQIAAESRMLSIRGQEVQKALRFYTAGENRPIEMVVTDVAKDRISGYLIMPVAQ